MKYYAHSKNQQGEFHTLTDHIERVAQIASHNMLHTQFQKFAYAAGIWHDLGKVHPKFQEKLIHQTQDHVDHKGFGFGLAQKYGSTFLRHVIVGHHGGLLDPVDIKAWWKEVKTRGEIYTVIHSAQEIIERYDIDPHYFREIEKSFQWQSDLIVRMIFSALVDADFLDTERHFKPDKSTLRVPTTIDVTHWKEFKIAHQKVSHGKTGFLNRIRQQIYRTCIEDAKKPPGFFRLTVPTGGGKTLSSLGFALKHALVHNKRRIIYAIPFTSIIEQTAGVFKKIFKNQTVLEHHTGIHSKETDDYVEEEVWSRMAAENWDAPIIVTTTVQLFESLLACSTSKCRKLHNLQNSVVILDEVQTLPLELLTTIMGVLNLLVQHFKVTVVFCTATQPALDEFLKTSGITPIELAPNPPLIFRKLERVKYKNYSREKWTWEQVVAAMKTSNHALAIVNTKKDARNLWEAFEDDSIYHLSAAMCGAHRRDVLDEIRKKLNSDEPCYLVATQVVEAGVDIDFERVFRALGPLDRIVQAGGRCNREGKQEYGEVVIFSPEDGSFPKGIYGVAMHKAGQLLNNPELKVNLNDPATFPQYFSAVRKNITERFDIEEARKALKFKSVAEKFKLIEDDTIPVVVNYNPEVVMTALDTLKYEPEESRRVIRQLQPYLVNLLHWEVRKCRYLLQEIFPGLFLWTGKYHRRLGLLKEIDLQGLVH
jgi:CRISPR-associated endonuclease/helicase Cas3